MCWFFGHEAYGNLAPDQDRTCTPALEGEGQPLDLQEVPNLTFNLL